MVISIQEHILAWEIEMCSEELSLAALGQVCPQHQTWANSFPRLCAAMAPGAQSDTSACSCMSEP